MIIQLVADIADHPNRCIRKADVYDALYSVDKNILRKSTSVQLCMSAADRILDEGISLWTPSFKRSLDNCLFKNVTGNDFKIVVQEMNAGGLTKKRERHIKAQRRC